ncbi:cytochrome P450 [Aspergillus parasiticus]|uniref:Cytochrome P450 monooxygenase otaC n=1 Tax=Aspergillus parasiticus TaxID=5067 RepID=A0A5N6DYJ4_ASPPA|nr:cytochrome P450 [Aspergillus parasiticus]
MSQFHFQPWIIALAGAGYLISLAVYRLWLSPLAKFPGPKLAALTLWYELYYDIYCEGQYTFQIIRMHEKYGPIVRISPWELHISDPDYYEVLYSRDSPRNKYEYYTRQFGLTKTAMATVDHYHHRLLRSNMNPYFAMTRIRKLEPLIQGLVDKLCDRLREFKGTGTPVALQYPFTCFATDVVTDYTMGAGFHYLDEPDFVPRWSRTLSGVAKSGVYIKPFPWLIKVFNALPESWLSWLNPEMDLTFHFQRRCREVIASIMEEQNANGYDKVKSQFSHPTFFHDVLNSNLPPEEKSPERLWQEVQVVVGAGAETTGKALTWTMFYLLHSPDKLQKLREELSQLDPDRTATLLDFEKMPYLTSVILEGLRLSYGLSTRLQRVAPDRALQFREWSIPAGTPVGMSSTLMHHDERIFPDSHKFIPERWLDLEQRKHLEKYMVAFTKGSRQCIGMNLARSEILLALPKVLRELDFELYETTLEDVTLAHDMFLPFPKMDSKGVRVLVK